MEFQKSNTKSKIRDIALVGMMAAIIYLATAFINVPSFYKGVIHAGDSMVFVAAVLFGKKKAALAAAVGMFLFDILSPYAIWAPFTFVIKGSMAYFAAIIAYRSGFEGKNLMNNIFAFIIAGLWMTFAYFIAGNILSVFVYGLPLIVSVAQNSLDIFSNILQVVIGMIIAVPITQNLKKIRL